LREMLVVSGGWVQRPLYGGHAWVFLNWLVGFQRLGFDVLFIDRTTPEMGVGTTSLAQFHSVMDHFGLANSYCIFGPDGKSAAGISKTSALAYLRRSLALLNFNGYLTDGALLDAAPVRVYVDIDPGFAQMWRELGLHDSLSGHDLFVTIAENIARSGCAIPTCGLNWITTRQPVVLDLWPPHDEPVSVFTSVGSWRGPFAPIEFGNRVYGLRVHEFRKFVTLPRLTARPFTAALDIHNNETADLKMLQDMGWHLVRPEQAVGNPFDYQDFIGQSKAEFMVAKNMYVTTQCGWFSDRSSCYLASGRPVIAQDTGLTGLYPVGTGLLTFESIDDAVAAVESVVAHYHRHARAAREIAESHFDSDYVLSSLLEKL